MLSVMLQGVVALLFAGSLLVAQRNLGLFRHNHQAMLLKSGMDEYRALVTQEAFDTYPDELESWRRSLAESELAPTMAYYTRLGTISQIGLFYDWVGLLVRKGLLDFDLCFEVVPMPYKFWADTQEFRAMMKEATYSEFWDPFEYLHGRYVAERRRRTDPPSIRSLIGEPTPRPKSQRTTSTEQ